MCVWSLTSPHLSQPLQKSSSQTPFSTPKGRPLPRGLTWAGVVISWLPAPASAATSREATTPMSSVRLLLLLAREALAPPAAAARRLGRGGACADGMRRRYTVSQLF
jgi:hypothetical protein